jgi:hypothetical protein
MAGLLVGRVASLGLAVGELHLLCVAVVGGDVEDVALLLAALVDLADGLVAGLDGGECSLILFARGNVSPVQGSELRCLILTTPV